VQIHAVFGIGSSPNLVWDNIQAIYQNFIAYVFTAGFLGMLFLYVTTRRNNLVFVQHLALLSRIALSFLSMLVAFKVVNFYISMFNPMNHDVILLHIDQRIFWGKTPSEWLDPIANQPLADFFSVAYSAWFFFTYATVLLLMKHSYKAVKEYVFMTLITFYLGYITYYFVPAIGPEFTLHYAHSLGPILPLVDGAGPWLSRDCFPSLHTGICIVMLVSIWRYRRNYFPFYLILITLIILSTQYLRVHYGIDVIAGACLAIMTTQSGPVWLYYWDRARQSIALSYPQRITNVPLPVSPTERA
jgi:membrane-associated phospholipid phosphatase